MSNKKWLRLLGTRYRCVPLYLPVEEFDPLSRLFLEVLRYEHSVARLVRAFGLTERVVEDVLGDLIRRNRATLVIQDGAKEIRLLDEDVVPNVVYKPGEALDVWQDHATGLVLPAWIVDPYERPRSSDGDVPIDADVLSIQTGPTLVRDFVQAPDAQLIEMMIRADDDLRRRDETVEVLDRLGERYRVRPQTVWLQVIDAIIQEQTIPLIAADFIPPWVARIWSVALRRDSFVKPVEEVAFHTASTTSDEGRRVVHGWRATALLDMWSAAVKDFLSLRPAPASGYDLRAVRERQAAVAGLFLSLGRIEIVEQPGAANAPAWFDPVLDVSRHWAAMVLPWNGQARAVLEALQKRVHAGGNLPTTVVIFLPSSVRDAPGRDEFQSVLGSARFVTVEVRRWPDRGPAVAVSDGPEVRLCYSDKSPALRLSGASIAAEWLRLLQALAPSASRGAALGIEEGGGDPLRSLRIRRESAPIDDSPRLGRDSEAPSVVAGIEELRAFGESLLTAIVDPQLIAGESTGESVGSKVDVALDKDASLGHQFPVLADRSDAILHQLLISPCPPWASWMRLAAHDLLPVFVGVLTESDRRSVEGEICIFSDCPSDAAVWSSVVELIRRATDDRGWVINIVFPAREKGTASPVVEDTAIALRQSIPNPRLRLWRLGQPFPMRALVLDDLIFLSGGDWLGSVLDSTRDGADFGFAIESRDLAETLRSCLVGASEVQPAART